MSFVCEINSDDIKSLPFIAGSKTYTPEEYLIRQKKDYIKYKKSKKKKHKSRLFDLFDKYGVDNCTIKKIQYVTLNPNKNQESEISLAKNRYMNKLDGKFINNYKSFKYDDNGKEITGYLFKIYYEDELPYIGALLTFTKSIYDHLEMYIKMYEEYNRRLKKGKLKKHNYRIELYDLFDEYGTENCKIKKIKDVISLGYDELNKEKWEYINSYPCINKSKYKFDPSKDSWKNNSSAKIVDDKNNFCFICGRKVKRNFADHINSENHQKNIPL